MYNGINKDIPLLNRTGSQICPAPEDELLGAVESNNFYKIDQLLSRNHQELLKVIYPYHDKTILLVACCLENIQPKTIEILSKYSDLGDYSEDDGQTAIHFAAQDAKYDILKILLEKRPDMIKDEELDGNNALHYLIRFGKDCEKFQQCLELFVAKGVNINHKNNSNKSPLDYANFLNIFDQVKPIIDRAQENNQKNVQNINNNNATTNSNNDELFELLKDQNEDAFINRITDENKDYSSKNFTLFQFCCEKNLNKAAKHLIKIGANVKLIAERNTELPIEIAENSGNSEIFKLIINAMDIEELPIGILVKIMKYIDNRPFGTVHDQKGCYRAYIDKLKEPGKYSPEQISLKINETLDDKFTALYFAIRFASPEIVRELLSLGASLGASNQKQKMAIDIIDPILLEKHLDDCIIGESNLKDSYKSDFTVKFEYRTLIPPYARMTKNLEDNIQDPEKAIMSSKIKCETVKEMEVISFISQTPGFKHLLKHPVIIAFLLLKWKKIQWIFWSNLIFYIIFLISLITYIFVDYANFSSNANSTRTLLGNISHIFLMLSLFALIFRELFQIFIYPLNYLKNFENYMEIILIFIASMLIFLHSPSSETRKQLSSLAILLAAFELVLMLGQHPYFSTNVLMFKTVSFNFFKFLIWYSLLIIAFAFSFYLLFTSHPTINESSSSDGSSAKLDEKNNATEKAPNDDGNFGDPGRSVFKTIIMLTGEFDASDLNFDTFPITSKLIFVLFIFMIAIILLNLLNGLAVSDIQIIKNDAELVGHIARAQYILHVENMLLGNIIPLNFLRELKTLFCCFNNNNDINDHYHQEDEWKFKIPKNPCLFPHDFENYSISFQPNKNGEVCREKNVKNANLTKKCLPCSTLHFNKDVVKKTMEIIKLRNEDNKEDSLKKLQEEVAELKLIIMKELRKSDN